MAAVLDITGKPVESTPTLASLVDAWTEAKRDEDRANERRIAIEQQILALQPAREEGSETVKLDDGRRVTITGKLSYSADMAKLAQLASQLPAERRPIKVETKLDTTGCKWLRANEPALWALIAPAITVKPAKASIEVKAA